MLKWALVFLIIALLAAVFGYGGISGAVTWIAQIVFWAFLLIAMLFFYIGRSPPD